MGVTLNRGSEVKNLDTIQAKCVAKLQSIYAHKLHLISPPMRRFPFQSAALVRLVVAPSQSGRVRMRDAIKAIDGDGSRKISAETFLCCAIALRVLYYDTDETSR